MKIDGKKPGKTYSFWREDFDPDTGHRGIEIQAFFGDNLGTTIVQLTPEEVTHYYHLLGFGKPRPPEPVGMVGFVRGMFSVLFPKEKS